MTWTTQDHEFMSRAVQLAARGRYTCDPNPRVGCVIVKDGELLAEGWHVKAGEGHAEINALAVCKDTKQTTVYVTLEPCSHQGRTPPCVDALIAAEVEEVIIAMQDPDSKVSGKGIERLQVAGIRVREGLLANEAANLNPGFIKRMKQGQAYVRCKLAMSLDGRTALANGKSQWITSVDSRKDVHKWRAASSAILSSVETVLVDNAMLNARDVNIDFMPPIRIVLDRDLRISDAAGLFTVPGKVVIYTEQDIEETNHPFSNMAVEIVTIKKSVTWLADVLTDLAERFEINEIWVEAGATLSGALIDANLVDELIVYLAPTLLGHDAQPLVKISMFEKLNEAKYFSLIDSKHFGSDIRLIYRLRT